MSTDQRGRIEPAHEPVQASVQALVVVPPGTVRAEPLMAAVRRHHPDWSVVAVWAGDPHLRPCLTDGTRWYDPRGETSTQRQRTLVTGPALDAVWSRALEAATVAFDDGASSVIVLVAGSVAVLGPIGALVPDDADAVLLARSPACLPDDDRYPGEVDLLQAGPWSTSAIGLSSTAGELLVQLRSSIAHGPNTGAVGPAFQRAATLQGVVACDDPAIGASVWRWDALAPALLDLPSFDPTQPWTLDPDDGRRARIDVADRPDRADALALAADQLAGSVTPIAVPGGLLIDDVIRDLVTDDITAPPPWSEPASFRAWLEPLYWSALHASRRDLAAAFPTPRGADAEAFRTWCRRAFVDDRVGVMLGVPAEPDDRWTTASALTDDGVNLVGYLTRESSLGDVARRVAQALVDADVAVAPLAYQRTASPHVDSTRAAPGVIAHRHTLAVVNADQFPALAADHPELFLAATHRIGYWFWELEHVPAPMRAAASLVDEIWAGSHFVVDAFRAAVDTPVRHVPLPLARPVAAPRTRASFEQLAPLGDRFVFAVVFDHFSVTERKNPVGVIDAFRRAFTADEGPVLVVKSMNAAKRWPQHQHVVAAAGGRPDIVLWDEHLERADHMALIQHVDALVALHRSEGLGLHLAEAMWLGTPVIATRYSGNLDFMDDDCSILIDATMVNVQRGEGVYPPEARWADPDLDQAVAAMRSLVGDPARCAALAAAGTARMAAQPTLADTGRSIAGLLGLGGHAARRGA